MTRAFFPPVLMSLAIGMISISLPPAFAAPPPELQRSLEHDDQRSAEKLRLIPASENSRALYGIDRWHVATDRSLDQLRYFIEATPVDSKLQPTSITVEIHARDGITVAVQREGRLRSITHMLSEAGEVSTFLTTPDDRKITLQGTNKSDRALQANELPVFHAIIGVASRATELRGIIDDVALDLPTTLIEALDSRRGENNASQKGMECFIPAATVGAVAAAIQYHLGPSGLVGCAATCATTAGCIVMSALSTIPACWGAAVGCAGCGAVGHWETSWQTAPTYTGRNTDETRNNENHDTKEVAIHRARRFYLGGDSAF